MQPGFVRIIAGKWRGRRLPVLAGKNLRPTPDRVRETLFNWLASHIAGARCLDLFAGSGSLGMEALSRGAVSVTLVDQSQEVVTHLQALMQKFTSDQDHAMQSARIYRATVPKELQFEENPYDVVFIDPPYQAELLLICCDYLEKNSFLAPSALIYLESGREIDESLLPSNWKIIKSKKAGQVFYALAKRS